MKNYLTLLIVVLMTTITESKPITIKKFEKQIIPLIEAEFSSSPQCFPLIAIISQIAEETGWGTSTQFTRHNNPAGLTCRITGKLMSFSSLEEGLHCYRLRLLTKTYRSSWGIKSPLEFISQLIRAHYCETPEGKADWGYVNRIASIMKRIQYTPSHEVRGGDFFISRDKNGVFLSLGQRV